MLRYVKRMELPMSLLSMILIVSFMAHACWLMAGAWLGELRLPQRSGKNAEKLNQWLQRWQLASSLGKSLAELGDIPAFKFFDRLAREGLRHARTFGNFPRELIWEWRDGIAREKAFDERRRSVLWGGYFQFMLFVLLTWAMVAMTGELMSEVPTSVALGMVTLQVAGMALFAPALSWLSRRKLQGLGELLESLYVLRSLSGAGLPTGKVITEAKLEHLPTINSNEVRLLAERTQELAALYQKQGGALGREAQILIQEAWFQREALMGQIVKLAEGLKLVFLLVFFAGAYFIFLGTLLFSVLQAN